MKNFNLGFLKSQSMLLSVWSLS